jgi:hypothetical protein
VPAICHEIDHCLYEKDRLHCRALALHVASLLNGDQMNAAAPPRAERYLRYSHHGMVVILVLVIATGTVFLAVALNPDGVIAQWMPRLALSVPIGIALIAGALQWSLRGDRWDPSSAEARAVLDDEWRQVSLARAARWALGAVLAAQVPLALWLGSLPAPRGVLAQAVATMTLGMAALVGLFLFFQRGGQDGD